MIKEGKFGTYEAVCLTSITIISKLFFGNISGLITESGTAAWQVTGIACLISMFFFFIICKLMERFPGQNIIEVFQQVFGRFAGSFIGVLYTGYAAFYASSSLREIVEMIKSYNLPYTPIEILIGSMLLTAAVMCYKGLECLTRVSVIFFVPIIMGMVLILILAIPSYDIMLFRPLWGYGIGNTLYHSIFRSSGYTEVLLLAAIAESLQGTNQFRKAGFISLAISGISSSISIFLYTLAYGYSLAEEKTSGLFELARDIYFNRFFQRVESIFLFAWVISSAINITVFISFYSVPHL